MRLKRYGDFTNEEINLKKALVGGAIGASTILPSHTHATEPVKKPMASDTVTGAIDESMALAVIDFVDTIGKEKPSIFLDRNLSEGCNLAFGEYEKISYLRNKLDKHIAETGIDLNLDILTNQPEKFPFNINYFLIRGLDNLESPTLLQILKLDYTAAVKIGGHEVMFNFTRVQDVNTFGAKINF